MKRYFHSQLSLTEKYLKILDSDQITCAEAAGCFMRFQNKLLRIPSGKKLERQNASHGMVKAPCASTLHIGLSLGCVLIVDLLKIRWLMWG